MSTPFRIALTFDAEHPDRPARPVGADGLLDRLAEAGVRSTWFVQGRWAEAHPTTARRIIGDGHRVGNHSHYHARLSLLRTAAIATDIRAAEAAIAEATGADPRPWFRCPFGDGARNARIRAVVERLGYREVGWHVDAGDWDPARSAGLVARDVVRMAIEVGDGAVVLLHAWPDQTLAALPTIIGGLREAGADLVTLDELDADRLPDGPS